MSSARDVLNKAMSEREFAGVVIDLARTHGWQEYHTYDSRHSQPGFPDLVLLRVPRVVFAELKTETGSLTPAQEWWIHNLGVCGQESFVWRPSDLGDIEQVLR